MSRIGKKPVSIPDGVTATVDGQIVTAKGPKGELKYVVNDEVLVAMEDGAVNVQPRNQSKDARSKWGMSRTMISNIMEGVKNGFERKLANPNYVDRAPARVVAETRERAARCRETIAAVQASLARL